MMELNILTICYLIGAITFIVGLKMLSNPATARNGNLLAAAGMGIAILGTIFCIVMKQGISWVIMVGYLAVLPLVHS
jgi:NAD/NADP transhydrogenase beta subunit